jgi:hypothetical protein
VDANLPSRTWARIVLAGLAGLSPVLGAGEPVSGTPRELRAATVLVGSINPFVLSGLVSSRVVVEVDWVAGYRPSPDALRAVELTLREHCVEGRRVEVLLDDEIPRAEWERATGRSGLERLVARRLGHDPADWRRTEVVYVLYAPDGDPWYGVRVSGMTDRITFERAGRVATVQAALLFTDEIRRDAMMWVTAAKVERATLIHELGHVIGLVGNPRHAQADSPRHCNVARCVMHRPGARAALLNGLPALFAGRIPTRFGPRCVEDIEVAKRMWSESAGASKDFVDRLLVSRRFAEAAVVESWKAQRDSAR